MIFFEIEGSRPANSSPETLMLLLLLLRLSSQANRNERRVEEGGPEGGCDILRDTSKLVRHFRWPSARSEPPNRGWTRVVSDNDANLAKAASIYRPRRLHHATDDNTDSRAAEVGPNLRSLCAKGISQLGSFERFLLSQWETRP